MSVSVLSVAIPPAERPGIPLVVAEKIGRFLASGMTGTIELNVTEGRVRVVKLTEVARVSDACLDRATGTGQDSR